MPEAVKVSQRNGIALLMLDNPPVNALSHAVRSGLHDQFQLADADPDIRGIVLYASGRTFSAGADIKEFARPPLHPVLSQLLPMIDGLSKPVVAAIGGAALGGGFELALACDARIATKVAVVGLPEVQLGLLPGAGGTQRLPRLIGTVAALDMIAGGHRLSAQQALDMGMIDKIVADDQLLDAAIEKAHLLAAEGRQSDRTRRPINSAEQAAFEENAALLLERDPRSTEKAAIIESIRNVFTLEFAAGCQAEQALFQHLRTGARSKALRHAFFAEHRSTQIAGVPRQPRQLIESVAVIGGGTMGAGIAISFANSGLPVTVIETDDMAVERASERIAKTYAHSVKRGSLEAAERDARLSRITIRNGLAHAAAADLVVEAAFEDIEVKRAIFSQLDAIAKKDAILATNTSYLDVNQIAEFSGRGEQALGMHFFSPANVMRLAEIVRGRETSSETLSRTLEVARRIGKIPVVVGVCQGFVGNRMLARRSEQMDRLLLEGATPDQIDAALIDFGFRMGPCAVGDLSGLDISWRMRKATGRVAPVADALCEVGRLGQKTGSGYFSYANGSRNGVVDQAILDLLQKVSASEGIRRRNIDKQEITERLIFPVIDEGARILHEGIARRSSDIDVIWLHGYGWPRWRGGPMHFGSRLGPQKIIQQLDAYAKRTGDPSLFPFSRLADMIAL